MKNILVFINRIYADSLYRNSFWLMAGSFTMAGIGFFYWLLASKLYTPTQIGLAATFLSAASLINGFATLGFNTTLLRYLPRAESRSKEINTALTVVSLAAMLFGVIYLVGLPLWTSQLMFLRESFPIIIAVIIFFPLNTINAISDSIFTALREAEWVFLSNIIQSLTKLATLFALSYLGTWGVIGSNAAGVIVAVAVCLIIILKRYKILFKPTMDLAVLIKVRRYAFGNYLSSMIGTLPSLILPIIITSRVSAEQTAYFYMPNMLISLLGIIPSTVSRSYFTESSHADRPVSMKKPLMLTYSIVLPAVVVFALFGKVILSLFGKDYSANGYNFLILLSISVLISVMNYFLGTKLLIERKMKLFTIIATFGSVVYLGGALLLSSIGIVGIGLASIANQVLSLGFLLLLKNSSVNRSFEKILFYK